MRAPEAAHDGRLAGQRAVLGVDAFELLEILLAGEDQMLVAGEDRVDAVDAGDEERGVLHHVALLHVDAGMRQRDHDVGALLLHLGTQALAASTMSRVLTLPSRFLASHIMICGGTKPMMPILIGCSAPLPSLIFLSRIT